MTQWGRDDDRLIAEKVECWKTRILNRSDLPADRPPIVVFSEWDGNSDGQDTSHGCWWKDDDGKRYFSIPFYDHDLEAAMRAAEARRLETGKSRTFTIHSEDLTQGVSTVILEEWSRLDGGWKKFIGKAPSPQYAEAICRALRKAVRS